MKLITALPYRWRHGVKNLMTDLEREILERVTSAIESGRPIEGVLFHGTCEPIIGPLHSRTHDGLLWTADNPVIAQEYIPASGGSMACSKPYSYEFDSRPRPTEGNSLYLVSKQMTGSEVTDIQRDSRGDLMSWCFPKGWPTNGEIIDYIEKQLGYEFNGNGSVWLKTRFEGGKEVFKPASWKVPGEVYMTLSDGLNLLDLRRGTEGDLSDPDHRRYHLFQKAADEGYDGVIINDFAQVEAFGNYGHVAYGLNSKGLEGREWMSFPAVNFGLDTIDAPIVTPQLEEWIESIRASEFRP